MTEAESFAWFMPGDPPPAPTPTEGCWDWPVSTTSAGYGNFRLNGKTICAHVAAFKIYHGPTNGLCVLHSCDRRICCQPAHLHLGTRAVNSAEMIERNRQRRGESQPAAKITEADVEWVRSCELSGRIVAETLGISQSQVSLIRRGQVWRHCISTSSSPTTP